MISYNFRIQSILFRSPETRVLAKKGKNVFSHPNLDTILEISKISQKYTFWKLDFSRIILFFFVNLVRDTQDVVLITSSFRLNSAPLFPPNSYWSSLSSSRQNPFCFLQFFFKRELRKEPFLPIFSPCMP